jgi:hypothetical protein
LATITATRRPTRSAASAGSRSIWLSAYRYSIATFWHGFLQALEEWNGDVLVLNFSGLGAEEPDHWHRPLLRTRHHRPRLPSPAMNSRRRIRHLPGRYDGSLPCARLKGNGGADVAGAPRRHGAIIMRRPGSRSRRRPPRPRLRLVERWEDTFVKLVNRLDPPAHGTCQ